MEYLVDSVNPVPKQVHAIAEIQNGCRWRNIWHILLVPSSQINSSWWVWWGRPRKVWRQTRHKVGANSIGGEHDAIQPFILPKTCFGFLSTAVEAASLSSQKTAIWLFVAKCAALTFIATRVCFGLLATKKCIFEAYISKNCVFPFCWETRCNQLYSTNTTFLFVRRKILFLAA